jgi:hypothetical protein
MAKAAPRHTSMAASQAETTLWRVISSSLLALGCGFRSAGACACLGGVPAPRTRGQHQLHADWSGDSLEACHSVW